MNTVMNLKVHKLREVCLLSESLRPVRFQFPTTVLLRIHVSVRPDVV